MIVVGKHEKPNCYSDRVQQAQRVNRAESVRLRLRIRFLDKERLHTIRCFNNDVRLLRLSLSKMRVTSGISPEGRPPWYKETEEERSRPRLIMYGDRIRHIKLTRKRSIKFGNKPVRVGDNEGDEEDDDADTIDLEARPQTCPPGSRWLPSPQRKLRTHTRFADSVRVYDSDSESDNEESAKKKAIQKRRANVKSAPTTRPGARRPVPSMLRPRLPKATMTSSKSFEDVNDKDTHSRPPTVTSCW